MSLVPPRWTTASIGVALIAGCATPVAPAESGSGGSIAAPSTAEGSTAYGSAAAESTAEELEDLADDVPGLGRSTEALARDDLIAFWEVWRRGQVTAQCMAESGFEWTPEVDYPVEALLGGVDLLGLDLSTASATTGPAPQEVNAMTLEGLAPAEKERYYQALHGESQDDMERVELTGELPEGRGDDFAAGGCYGRAMDEIGSIWDLKRTLGAEALTSSMSSLQERYPELFEEQRARYQNAIEQMRADTEFTDFFATYVAQAS